jgi:hypothetical protein
MNPNLLTSDFQKKIQTLCTIPEARPQFKKELKMLIQTKANRNLERRKALSKPRLAWLILITVIIISFTTTFILGPQKVWAAVQGLVGFIPGIGFVEETNPVRSLSHPLQQTQGGVTVTIMDTIVTESSTIINISIQGILSDEVVAAGTPQQSSHLQLNLPDLTRILLKGYNISFAEREPTIQLVFETLPPDVSHINLSFDSIPGISGILSPIGWSFRIELSTNQLMGRPIPARSLNLTSEPNLGLVFKVNSIAYLHDSTAIEIQMVSNAPNVNISQNWWNSVAIYDQDERYYPFKGMPIRNLNDENIITVFTEKLDPIQFYTISVPNGFQLIHQVPQDNKNIFELDLNDAIGQNWELNRQFSIDNHSITLTSARLISVDNDRVLLKFQYAGTSEITNIMVFPLNEEPTVTRIYPDGIEFEEFPTHSMQFRISSYQTFIRGNWKVTVPSIP